MVGCAKLCLGGKYTSFMDFSSGPITSTFRWAMDENQNEKKNCKNVNRRIWLLCYPNNCRWTIWFFVFWLSSPCPSQPAHPGECSSSPMLWCSQNIGPEEISLLWSSGDFYTSQQQSVCVCLFLFTYVWIAKNISDLPRKSKLKTKTLTRHVHDGKNGDPFFAHFAAMTSLVFVSQCFVRQTFKE